MTIMAMITVAAFTALITLTGTIVLAWGDAKRRRRPFSATTKPTTYIRAFVIFTSCISWLTLVEAKILNGRSTAQMATLIMPQPADSEATFPFLIAFALIFWPIAIYPAIYFTTKIASTWHSQFVGIIGPDDYDPDYHRIYDA